MEDEKNWSFEMSCDDGKTWCLSSMRDYAFEAQRRMAEWSYISYINGVKEWVRIVQVV